MVMVVLMRGVVVALSIQCLVTTWRISMLSAPDVHGLQRVNPRWLQWFSEPLTAYINILKGPVCETKGGAICTVWNIICITMFSFVCSHQSAQYKPDHHVTYKVHACWFSFLPSVSHTFVFLRLTNDGVLVHMRAGSIHCLQCWRANQRKAVGLPSTFVTYCPVLKVKDTEQVKQHDNGTIPIR